MFKTNQDIIGENYIRNGLLAATSKGKKIASSLHDTIIACLRPIQSLVLIG